MTGRKLLVLAISCGVMWVAPVHMRGQVFIHGTVFDQNQNRPLTGVSVLSISGVGTSTDSLGHYQIRLPLADSIFFSYLGKRTNKFAVADLIPGYPFDMRMQLGPTPLPQVLVMQKDYKSDSIATRQLYEKTFDYNGQGALQGLRSSPTGAGFSTAINMDALLGSSHSQEYSLQQRLQKEERDKYIDRRFSPALVKKITGLQSPALDTFLHRYRPSFELVRSWTNDYEMCQYIQVAGQSFLEIWNRDHPYQ